MKNGLQAATLCDFGCVCRVTRVQGMSWELSKLDSVCKRCTWGSSGRKMLWCSVLHTKSREHSKAIPRRPKRTQRRPRWAKMKPKSHPKETKGSLETPKSSLRNKAYSIWTDSLTSTRAANHFLYMHMYIYTFFFNFTSSCTINADVMMLWKHRRQQLSRCAPRNTTMVNFMRSQ